MAQTRLIHRELCFLSIHDSHARESIFTLKCMQTSLHFFLLFFKYLSPTFCCVPLFFSKSLPASSLRLCSSLLQLSFCNLYLCISSIFLLSRLSLDTWHYFLNFNEVCSTFIWILPTSLSLLSSTRATCNEEKPDFFSNDTPSAI